jgi:hypothetical protein
MNWMAASLRAFAIFFYFVVLTVFVPDLVIGLNAISSASNFVRDAVVLVVWGSGLVAGLWMLRRFQARDLI